MSLSVNGQAIPNQLIVDEMQRLRPEYEVAFKDMEHSERETQLCAWATENVIERTLLHQEARSSDITISENDLQEALSQLRKSFEDSQALYEAVGCEDEEQVQDYVETTLKAEKLLEDLKGSVPPPPAEAIEQFYQSHPEQFQSPERVHAAHIVVHVGGPSDLNTAQSKIQAALQALQEGKPFPMVAEQFSDCPENGGDLGFFSRGQMVEEFEAIVFNLGVGQISEIFQTRYGLHLATVYHREPAALRPIKDVREHVIQALLDQKQNEIIYAFLDDLKAKAVIQKPE